MANDEYIVQTVAGFELGEITENDEFLVLSLLYATSQEKLSRREMESVMMAISREQAIALGTALIRQANTPPSGRAPATLQ
jgi:hypothetical protein